MDLLIIQRAVVYLKFTSVSNQLQAMDSEAVIPWLSFGQMPGIRTQHLNLLRMCNLSWKFNLALAAWELGTSVSEQIIS